MKIDLHFADLTPVEAQRVLIGMSFAEDILGKISPAIKIEKATTNAPDPRDILRTPQPPAMVQVSDPTCDEETGCDGCDNKGGQDFERCHACSPSPVPSCGTGAAPSGATVATPAPQAKKPRGHARKGSRYKRKDDKQIPFHSINEKAAYQRAQKLCKKYNCSYPEALKKSQEDTAVRQPNHEPGEPPAKGKKPRAAPRKIGRAYLDPENQHPAPSVKKIRDLVIAKNGELKAGMLVRHNGPKASPFFGKEGEILKVADDGQAFVKFGESATWMPAYNIVVIPAAAEAGA